MECVGIMVVGVIAGLLLGIAMVFGLGDDIGLSAFSECGGLWYVHAVEACTDAKDLLLFGGLSVLLGFFANYFPARRALQISPLMAMNR